jgi:hypothetical protein
MPCSLRWSMHLLKDEAGNVDPAAWLETKGGDRTAMLADSAVADPIEAIKAKVIEIFSAARTAQPSLAFACARATFHEVLALEIAKASSRPITAR